MKAAFSTLLLVPACAISTDEIYVAFEVRLDAPTLSLRAYFLDEPYGQFVDVGDVTVDLSFRGQNYPVTVDGPTYYRELLLDSPIADGEPVSIVVTRDGESPITSTMALPPQLVVDPLPLFVPRSKDLTLSWQSITDDPMRWDITDHCVSGNGEIPSGVGSFTIPATTIAIHDGLVRTCTATLVVARERVETVDTAFAGAELSFADRVTIPFASTP